MQEAAHERGLASGLPQRPRRSYEWAGENNGRGVISAIFARARGFTAGAGARSSSRGRRPGPDLRLSQLC